MPPITEVTRERETFIYSSRLFDGVCADTRAAIEDGDTNTLLRLSWPPDPTLTAFAQLTLFKLNVTRCLISLFDQNYQYIVAQATPSCALTVNAEHKEAWLDGNAMPRHLSICDAVIRSHDRLSSGDAHTLPVSVISDLREEARYCSRTDVQDVFYKRFYAGVPIRSPSGINIGVLCVFDEQPRHGLDDVHTQILQEMSRMIMGRLTALAFRQGSERSERMLRGIDTFLRQKTATYGLGSVRADKGSASIGVKMGQEEGAVATAPADCSTESHCGRKQDVEQPEERPAPVPLQPSTSDAPTPLTDSRITADSATDERPKLSAADQPQTFSTTSTVSFGGELVQREVGAIFGAAASLIRDSVEADGVYFLDATISYENLDSDPIGPAARPPGDSQTPKSMLGHHEEEKRSCRIIGASLSKTDDAVGNCQTKPQLSVPQSLLQRLLGHYPHGTIFNYDRTGAPMCSDSDLDLYPDCSYETNLAEPNASSVPNRQEARMKDSDFISHLLPGARCVAFVPVWSSRHERWYAGSLVWTRNLTRVFTTESELTYIQTFGATIMAEVARINTVAAEKAKYDLLGSVSHELRSPLHGIIASAELLQDTNLDSLQGDVLRSIESCGRTLLDVLDHLLDFTKINRFKKISRDHSSPGKTMQGLFAEGQHKFKSQMTLTGDIQVDALVEETVESVSTGYHFHETSVPQLLAQEDQSYRTTPSRTNSISEGPWGSLFRRTPTVGLPIFLDIDPNIAWHCRTQPGALRRVIMNLVGNSLKFTKKGWVLVRLQQEPVGKYLILTVSDTGSGISAEFLNNHIFAPFSQEDHLTPGAGLGLSLVHDVVEAFNGTINIESRLGYGTVARVTLPWHLVDGDSDQDNQFRQHISALKGLRVSVVGFSDDKRASLPRQTPFSERTLMERLCVEWLGLELIHPDAPEVRPDLLICNESSLNQVVPSGTRAMLPPIVVICRSALVAHTLSNSFKGRGVGGVLECMSQPAGPRKVARAMVLAMERNHDLVDQEIPTDQTDTADLRSCQSSEISTDLSEITLHDANVESRSPMSSVGPSPFEKSYALSMRPRICRNPSFVAPLPSLPSPLAVEGVDSILTSTKDRTRYLLVDDNKLNLKILIGLMKKLKRDWKTAENGVEAVEAYTEEPAVYAGVLMDLSMPIMDGFEATRRIREYERTQNLTPTTVVALTGLASGGAQQEAFASGIDVFMTKPARLKELAEVLAKNDRVKNST